MELLNIWTLPLLLSLLFALGSFCARRLYRRKTFESTSRPVTPNEKQGIPTIQDVYKNIEPLRNFNVDLTEPTKHRPFKPKFHLTMAIENATISEFIAMDKTYRERIQIRSQLIQDEHHEVIACNPKAESAVFEIYEWLTLTYLPQRFPSMFTLTDKHLQNLITGTSLPLHPSSAISALEIIGSNIDNEFFFLLPSSDPLDNGKYRLGAFITCFPNGFNTRSKLGLLLADIHKPVPSYKEKIEKSMDRFFAALPAGKVVKRANWSISTTGQLFCLQGNHMSAAELEALQQSGDQEDVDLSKAVLRCERQTLHRLPKSGAIIFSFKTYQYPIREIKDEGNGEALAQAIDGMKTGSVPEIAVYKRQVIWGEKVKAFLRGDIDA